MKKQRPLYNTDQVLELAIVVDSNQGFVKSGHGYFDRENDIQVYDNKTAIMQYIQGDVDMPEINKDIQKDAAKIKESFRDELIAKKLMGRLNTFEESVLKSLSNDAIDNFGVSILASLPNSFRVQKKRQSLDDWFDTMRDKSEFVGKIGERIRFSVNVKDVKFIAKYGIHLVTCVNDEDNLIKFFFSKEPDIAGLLENKTVIITGKVKQHDVSKFSDCKETVINYVKIEEKC